jgi:hypothetical protein
MYLYLFESFLYLIRILQSIFLFYLVIIYGSNNIVRASANGSSLFKPFIIFLSSGPLDSYIFKFISCCHGQQNPQQLQLFLHEYDQFEYDGTAGYKYAAARMNIRLVS